MKKVLINLLLLVALAFGASKVFAYDLTLTKIGTLSTIGADYSLVAYTGAIPGLEGTATPAASVTVIVNSTASSVLAATASGVWSFTPATLKTGDNQVTLLSGTQTINFIIRYSPTTTTTTTTSTSSSSVTSLPEAGVWENVAISVVLGVAVFYLGGLVRRKMHIWENGK